MDAELARGEGRAARARRCPRSASKTRSPAARVRSRGLRLASRERSRTNGTTKWKNRMTQADRAPAAAEPRQVPGDLLGDVAGPDDQVLGEVDVRPHHHERQEHLAEVVQDGGRRESRASGSKPGERTTASVASARRRQRLADHEVDAVHRRVPVRLERHDPVDRGEGDRQRVDDETAAREKLQLAVDLPVVGRGVLLARPAVEEVRERESSPEGRPRRAPVKNGMFR